MALEKITASVRSNCPQLLEDEVIIKDFCFWDCTKNVEIPVKDLDEIKVYLVANKITDFALVIYFSNNIIGYRLSV